MKTELELNTITLQLNNLRDNIIFDKLNKNKKYIDTEEIIYEESKENNKTFISNQSKRNSFASTHKIGVKNMGNTGISSKNMIKKHLSIDGLMKDNIKRNSFLFWGKNNELLYDSKNQINNYLNMNINVNINVNNQNFNKKHYSTSSLEEDNNNNSEEKSQYEIELNNNNKIIFTPIPTAENFNDND